MPKESDQEMELRHQSRDLLSLIVEPTNDEKEELQKKKGLLFLPINSQSCADIIAKNKSHFWDNELEFANSEPDLQQFTLSKAVEVGLIEGNLALPGSFRQPRSEALKMIDDYSQELAIDFPDFRAIMLPAAGYASVDMHYSRWNNGKVLFRDNYTWCLDNARSDKIPQVDAVFAGRYVPTLRFFIGYHDANYGYGSIGAVPAIVKVGRK